MKRIILASASPRRRELLEQIGLRFEVIPSKCAEVITKVQPGEIVEELSFQKAADVAASVEEGIVIGSDTIVWQDGHVMGKPADREHARAMLRQIQGSTHSVFTGVTVIVKENGREISHTFYKETKVHVYPMTEAETERYMNMGEPTGKADGRIWNTHNGHQPEWCDKAGAYGIQGAFAAYVEGIEGDYNSVVGLPVAALWQVLKKYM